MKETKSSIGSEYQAGIKDGKLHGVIEYGITPAMYADNARKVEQAKDNPFCPPLVADYWRGYAAGMAEKEKSTMTFDQALSERDRLDGIVGETLQALKQFPKLSNGLTPDNVKSTQEYKTAKADFDESFLALQTFNKFFVKHFKQEYRTYRQSKG